MRILIICVICGLICGSGCVDNGLFNITDIDDLGVVSVNEKGDVAFCTGDGVYITDLNGSKFTKITDNEYYHGCVSWSNEGLLYTERANSVWTLNFYKPEGGSSTLLQEMDKIAMPIYKEKLSYVVLSKEEAFGNINIYEEDTSRIYTVLDNAYYDYEWLPKKRKIIAISATNVNEDKFQGVLLTKDIDDLSEKIIFNGTFIARKDYLDKRDDNNIIFSSEGEIYLYNMETEELSKWHGKVGYDYKLPFSVDSNLKGYVLAKVKGVEEGWGGQLYLVKPDGEFISVPGLPLWIREPMLICMDTEKFDIIVKDLDKNEIVNLMDECEKNRKIN